jgi:hypothetical protein
MNSIDFKCDKKLLRKKLNKNYKYWRNFFLFFPALLHQKMSCNHVFVFFLSSTVDYDFMLLPIDFWVTELCPLISIVHINSKSFWSNFWMFSILRLTISSIFFSSNVVTIPCAYKRRSVAVCDFFNPTRVCGDWTNEVVTIDDAFFWKKKKKKRKTYELLELWSKSTYSLNKKISLSVILLHIPNVKEWNLSNGYKNDKWKMCSEPTKRLSGAWNVLDQILLAVGP